MYGNLTDWRAHALARGNSAPTEANDAEALAALQRASDYIQYRYVAILAQGYDETLSVVEPATYEAARLELATPGLFTKTFTQSEQKVLTGVDSIRWTVTGKTDGTHSAMPVSTLIHAMFEPYVNDPDDMNFGLRAVGG